MMVVDEKVPNNGEKLSYFHTNARGDKKDETKEID